MIETRSIADTDIEVSVVCLGTMTFGHPVGEADAVRLVHWSIDHGINFIDTADMYEGYDRYTGSPGGVGELILGKAIRGRRESVILTTKVGNPIGRDGYAGGGLSVGHIQHQIDASLQRLQTDYVDFYLLHRPDADAPLAESVGAVAALISEGKVRHWGFSNFEPDQIREMIALCAARGWPRPVVSQPPYSWQNRHAASEHFPVCREHGISITPYRPLQGGLLTGKYRREQPLPQGSRAEENADWLSQPDEVLYSGLEAFEQEAQAHARTPLQHAFRWILDQPGISSVVVGAKRIEQVEEMLGI